MSALLVSCRTVKPPGLIEITTKVHDTIEKVRDTTIIIPADSSWLKALLECDANGKISIKKLTDYWAGKSLKPPTIEMQDNYILVKAKVDSVAVYAALKDRYYTSKETQYKEKTVEVNFVSGWQWAQIWAGRLLMLIGFLWAIYYLVIRSPVVSNIQNVFKK